MVRRYDKSFGLVTRRSGVYAIVNLKNGKVYVGSALSIRGRLTNHRNDLRGGKHCNSYLQRAWDKSGEKAFRFDVLEECEPFRCVEREQYWIDSLKSFQRSCGYNLNQKAGNDGRLGCKHTAESRAKMSASHRGSSTWQNGVLAAARTNRGKSRPLEVRRKIGNSQRGKPTAASHREAMMANHWSKRRDAAEIIRRSVEGHRRERARNH